jgi:hypothetical protein
MVLDETHKLHLKDPVASSDDLPRQGITLDPKAGGISSLPGVLRSLPSVLGQTELDLTSDSTGEVKFWWRAPEPIQAGPYHIFARLLDASAQPHGAILFVNVRPLDPLTPIQINRVGSTPLSKPVASLSQVPVTLNVTRGQVAHGSWAGSTCMMRCGHSGGWGGRIWWQGVQGGCGGIMGGEK